MKQLLFLCPQFGMVPDAWMWRQVTGIRQFNTVVLTGSWQNRQSYPVSTPVEIVPGFCSWPATWPARLRTLLQGALEGNWQAAMGAERRQLTRLTRQYQPHIMLAQFAFTAMRMLPVAQRLGIPLAVYIHGWDLSALIRGWFYRRSLINTLPDYAAFFVVGRHHEKWLLDHGVDQHKIHYLPCGAPTDEFSAKQDASQPAAGPVRFAMVSRLVEMKGVLYSLQAFARVCQSLPDSELYVAGEGPQQVQMEQLAARLGVAQRVHFLGPIPPDQVRQLLLDSDIFLQHSVIDSHGSCEGFGVSVAEASASGLPVVCSDSPGLVDQVVDGQTGYIVPQKDIAAMADKMLLLAGNPVLRRQLGQAGRRRMVELYDTRCQIAKLETTLLSLAR